MEIRLNIISTAAAALATIISVAALIFSIATHRKLSIQAKKQATIEAFNRLQQEVLDKLVSVDAENARVIVEDIENNDKCKEAYDDYRTLIARLEHFSIGVLEDIYDFKIVDKLGGVHLMYLYTKVQPVIDKANEHTDAKNYQNYLQLVSKLKKLHEA